VNENGFHVVADIARLGQCCCVGDGERHIKNAGQRLSEERLSGSRRSDQKNVGLLDLDVVGVESPIPRIDAFEVIVHGDGEGFLRVLLADNIIIQRRLDA
jgi:hypothetical protein